MVFKEIKVGYKWLLLFLVVLICLPVCSPAQQWSGIVDPSRAIDWSNVGVSGGIPTRNTICATLNPGATATQINSAIQSCGNGQVVFLSAGTYNLSAGIDFANKSGVTLRGAGADQTFLLFTDGTSCHGQASDICVGNTDTNWPGGPSNTATWTAGYAKGTTQITLSSTTNLAAGNILMLDQLNDTSDPGTIFICSDGPPPTPSLCADEGASGGQRAERDQIQIVTVQNVQGSTVTISPALYMPNWSSGKSPGAWWPTTVVKNDGVENMSLDHTNSAIDSSGAGITLFNSLNCWVKGIRSINSPRSHVRLYLSAKATVRDSYFYGTRNSASQSYGVESYPSSDSLIENNIFQHVTSPEMLNAASSGDVIGYNFSINDYYTVATWLIPGGWLHAGGIDNALFEGNQGSGFIADSIHGTHTFTTGLRNFWNGWEAGKLNQTTPVHIYTYGRYFNIIGNVLGEVGYHNVYECATPASCNQDTAIYALGYAAGDGNNLPDTNVKTYLMRWGNYDTVNNAVRFVNAEVPSGVSPYGNPVPSSQNLPASFYYSSQPAWWTSGKAWPPIGPDVSGGNVGQCSSGTYAGSNCTATAQCSGGGTCSSAGGGHVKSIPAMDCYLSTMSGPPDGSGNPLRFNASTCYAAQKQPAPPTNLSAVSQ